MSFELKIRNTVRPASVIVDNSPADNVSLANKSYVDTAISTAVAAKTITLTGEVTGSGNNSFATTLSSTGVVPGTYNGVTVDSKGRVTGANNVIVGGDMTASYGYVPVGLVMTTTLANTAVTPGVYSNLTIDSKGRITNAVPLSNSHVTTALGYEPVNKAGDTMTGSLNLQEHPSDPLHAASKSYVDGKFATLFTVWAI